MSELRLTLCLSLSMCLWLSAALPSRAATIDVTGTAGTPGTPADLTLGLPAGNGGSGESLSATAGAPDAVNQVTVTGGTGGAGGAGTGDSSPHIGPGAGGSGGEAVANANSTSTADPVSATAVAHGGTGGAGGRDGPFYGPPPTYPMTYYYGPGGGGGAAESRAAAHSTAGAASAVAESVGGPGGFGGSSNPGGAYRGGFTGNAFALAESSSELSDSSADARASGSHGLALADSTSGVGNATAFARTTGVTGNPSSLEPTDSVPLANASARSLGAGNAEATAIATANDSAYQLDENGYVVGYLVGSSRATAEAYSDMGNATAHATQIAGAPPPTYPAPLDGYPDQGGGPGSSSVAQDLVRGSAHGTLTLIQDAVASDGTNGSSGGAATSTLMAANPAGGDLRGEVIADAGSGGVSCATRLFPPICTLGAGGNALATVEASGPFAASIEARAHAFGGRGGEGPSSVGAGSIFAAGGTATSTATAAGGHSLFAQAESVAQTGSVASADAGVLGVGGIGGARAHLDFAELAANPSRDSDYESLVAEAGLRAATQHSGTPAIPAEGAYARMFAAPGQADVDTWLDGNPNAQAALAGRDVVALGSLGIAVSYRWPSGEVSADETLRLHGSASLDLTAASFEAGDTLALALLDPTGSFSVLDLSLTRDGTQLFQESLSGNAAGLDDVIVELGEIVVPGDPAATYTLSWLFEIAPGDSPPTGNAFSLDFAFLGQVPVPEPSAAAFLILSGVALARRRLSAGS